MIRLACPKCSQRLSVPAAMAGKLGKCPACGDRFRIPAAPSSAVTPRPAEPPQPAPAPAPKAAPPAAPKAPASSGELPDFDDIKLLGDEPVPAPKPAVATPKPAPKPAARAAVPPERKAKPAPAAAAPNLDGFELLDDDPPPPKPRPGRPPRPPVLDAVLDLELVDEVPAPPPAAPKSKPASKPVPKRPPVVEVVEELDEVEEVEVVEDGPPAARRRPRLGGDDAVTGAPAARRRPALDDDRPRRPALEDDEDDARPRRRRRADVRRPVRRGGVPPALLIVLAVVGVAWLVLTPLAFFYKYVAVGMLVVGFPPATSGRIWLARIMHRETKWLHRLIPFYEFYFVFTRLGKTFAPLVLWACGLFFLASGGICFALHESREHRGAAGGRWGGVPVAATTGRAAEQERFVADCLANKPWKEAREWLRQPGQAAAPVLLPMVDQAYANGAKQVLAVNLRAGFNGQPNGDLVIVLPDDLVNRGRVFAWRETMFHEDTDVGQKYLLFEADSD